MLNIIAPLTLEELHEDLTKSSFVILSMDAANRKEIQIVPIFMLYFKQNTGVQIKILDFKSVPGETAVIYTNCWVLW